MIYVDEIGVYVRNERNESVLYVMSGVIWVDFFKLIKLISLKVLTDWMETFHFRCVQIMELFCP